MALPLPRVVADVGPGGGIVTSMMGQNALTQANLQNYLKGIEAQYAPMTYEANARAKQAYANLMGPQFVAKLLENENTFANFPNAQGAINAVTGAGLNSIPRAIQQGANPVLNSPYMNPPQNRIVYPNIPAPFNQVNNDPNQVATPQQVHNFANERWKRMVGNNNQEVSPQQSSRVQNQADQEVPENVVDNRTVQQRVADFRATKAQGEETGKIRAKAIDDFDQQYEAAIKSEIPIKNLVRLLNDPVFVGMRNKVPLFQQTQLKALSKIGTPEEQDRIGQFVTNIKQQAASVVQGFKGRAMDKEFQFADQMKVNDNDTVDVAIGKIKAIEQYNELTKQMAQVSSQLIDQKHMNRGDALRAAGKIIDADKIRQDIEFMFRPPVTEKEIHDNMINYNKTREEVVNHVKKNGYKLEIELLPQYRNKK